MTDWLGVETSKVSIPGQKRSPHNEDWVEYYEPEDPVELANSGRLYLVADGVGGASRGERASQYAAQKILYDFYQSAELDLGDRLKSAVRAANADIHRHTENSLAQNPMGTTVVAAALRGRELVVANVGDSRAYLIRGTQIHQISRDHSLMQELLDEGELTPDEARNFRRKNVIMRSVGADEYVEVDIFKREVKPGDTVLLCTDGLYKYFPEPGEIAQLAANGAPEQAARQLVDLANSRGGSDNISAMIVRLREPEGRPVQVGGKRAGRVAAPDWDTMPTATRPPIRRVRKRLYVGGRPMSRPMAVALLGGAGALVVVMLALGIAVGTQVFGQYPAPPTSALGVLTLPAMSSETTLPDAEESSASPLPLSTDAPTDLTPTSTASSPALPSSLSVCIYIVKPRDTATNIAATFGIAVGEIKNGDPNRTDENGAVGSQLEKPDSIQADQRLIIPNLPDGSCPTGTTPEAPSP